MQHWLPFDETRLYAALEIDNVALERSLRNDHRTIAQLALRRAGRRPKDLAKYLVGPRRADVSIRHFRALTGRTLRVLTQGHLAQHLFFHYYHVVGMRQWSPRIYGVPWRKAERLRQRGLTPMEVGHVNGKSPSHVKLGFRRALRDQATRGVRRGAQTPEQAAFMLRRRTGLLRCFLHRPLPRFHPGNPYGERYEGHGPHSRHVRNGLLRNSKQVRARRDPSYCWAEPLLVVPAPSAESRAGLVPPVDGVAWSVVEGLGAETIVSDNSGMEMFCRVERLPLSEMSRRGLEG
jgi:hypothetical protein